MQSKLVSITALAVAGASLVLAGCGSSGASSSSTTLPMSSTNYITQPTTPVTVAPTTDPLGPAVGTITTDVTEYEIVAGDYPLGVAKLYNITVEQLDLANVDTEGYAAFFAGLKIKIPAGATVPGTGPVTTNPVDPTATTTPTGPTTTTTTIAGGQPNCGELTYTIVEGDYPGLVASKFDITVTQLDAANVNTNGYSAFIVGVEIRIPGKADC